MESWRGRAALVGVAVSVSVVAWAIWYAGLPDPGGLQDPPAAGGGPTGPPAPRIDHDPALPMPPGGEAPSAAGPEEVGDLLRRLEVALAQGDPYAIRAAARSLRAQFLFAERETVEAMATALLDGARDLRLRQALAIVLGSLPGEFAQALLADLLTRCTGPPELVCSLLLALGELKEGPGAGDFGAEDVPFGEADPSGLAVRVRGPLRGEGVSAAVPRLSDGNVETRRVAALVLRDSVAQPVVRAALLGRLPVEPDDEACGEVGAALVATAVDADPSDAGRAEVVRALLDVSRRAGRDVTRFRIEAGLGSATLNAAEEAELVGLLGDGDVLIQMFALEALGRRLREEGTTAPASQVAGEIGRLLVGSPEAKVRETAARVIHPAAASPEVALALMRALESDAAWEVRATAAQALGAALVEGMEIRPGAIEALQKAAAGDLNEEVRAAARAALDRGRR